MFAAMSGKTQLEYPCKEDGGAPCGRESLAGLVIDGRYRLDSLIGEGGMGAVYRAEQVYLHRPVAVKVLHPEFAASTDAVGRFRREAELMARLDSRHIVQVIDFGVTGEGRFYLVLELLSGESLHELMAREGRATPAVAADLLRQLLDGLGAAHEAGIVHRDLKPENLWLVPGVGGPLLKILDFGIAKLASDPGASDGMTRTGWIVGTPEYLAPEQAMGKPVDCRADLYAAGIIAYLLLTGRHPFGDAGPREMLQAQILTPIPSAAVAVPELAGYPGLLQFIARATEKDVEKRAGSALELSRLITVSTETVSVPVADGTTPPRRLPGKPAAWLAIIVLLAAACFGAWRADLYLKGRPVADARQALEQGRPERVLAALAGSDETTEVLVMKGRALFDLSRYEEGLKAYQTAAGRDRAILSDREVVDDIAHEFRGPRAESAAKLLEESGEGAVGFLLEASSDRDFKTRWRAIESLKRMNRADRVDMAAAYMADLKVNDCAVMKRAAKSLGDLGDLRAVEPLREMSHRTRSIFWDACEAPAARAALKKLEKDKAKLSPK